MTALQDIIPGCNKVYLFLCLAHDVSVVIQQPLAFERYIYV